MIKHAPAALRDTLKYFPHLRLNEDKHKISGEIYFYARYKTVECDGISNWVIEPGSRGKDNCVEDVYSIEIDLRKKEITNAPPIILAVVFETEGRIEKLASSMGKDPMHLHLNGDGSCCLGIFPPRQLSLRDFVLERVYPYFVWQSYYEKYDRVPPCGECPHSFLEALDVRIIDEENKHKLSHKQQKNKSKGNYRNRPCHCGSMKKYKKCCGASGKTYTAISNAENSLSMLKQLRTDVINKCGTQNFHQFRSTKVESSRSLIIDSEQPPPFPQQSFSHKKDEQ